MFRNTARFAFFLLLIVGMLTPASAAKRVALVIGNSAYTHATPLRNPSNDADAIAAVLEKLGFEVVKGIDLAYRDFGRTIGKFRSALEEADVALFFYAGHGLQVNGNNYLAPVDAELQHEDSLEFEAVTLRTILRLMERRERTNLVFLDACRDNPLARNLARGMGTRSTAIGRGLAREETGIGTMIAFATQPSNVALDGQGKHSPFTEALVKHIETPGLDIAELMRKVRLDVIDATRRQQVPWNHSSLTGSFMFKDRVVEEPKVDEKAVEMAMWLTASAADTAQGYKLYLERYPEGARAQDAKTKLATLIETREAEAARRSQAEAKRLRRAEEERIALKAERERMAKEREAFAKRLEQLEAQAKEREVAALEQSKAVEKPKAEPTLAAHLFDGRWTVAISSKTGCRNNAAASYDITVRNGMFEHKHHKFPKKGRISPSGEFSATVYNTSGKFLAAQTASITGDHGKGRVQGKLPSCKGVVSLVRFEKAENSDIKVAELKQIDASRPDTARTDAEPNPREFALALQTELKRVGCEPGPLDGNWGRKGRAALTRFNTYAKLSLPVAEPTLQAVDAIKEKKIRVCPLPVAKPKPVKKTSTAKTAPPAKKQVKQRRDPDSECKFGLVRGSVC